MTAQVTRRSRPAFPRLGRLLGTGNFSADTEVPTPLPFHQPGRPAAPTRDSATERTRKYLKKHASGSRLSVVRPHVVLHLVASFAARSATSRPIISSPP